MEIKARISDYLSKLLIINAGIIINICIFINYFKLLCSPVILSVFTFLIVLIIVLIMNCRHRNILICALALIMIVTVIIFRNEIKIGLYYIAEQIINRYSFYFENGKSRTFSVLEDVSKNNIRNYTTFIISIGIVEYAYILVTSTWFKMYAFIHIVMSAIFLASGMVLGLMPTALLMIALIIYYLCCFVFQHESIFEFSKLISIMCVGIIASLMVVIINNPGNYKKVDYIDKLKNKLNQVAKVFDIDHIVGKHFENNDVAEGGMGDGSLGDVDVLEYSNKIMLNVTMTNSDKNVYLRHNVYSEYCGNHWEKISSDNTNLFEHLKDDFSEDLVNKGFTYIESNSGGVLMNRYSNISLTATDNEKDANFIPYFSLIDQTNIENDLMPQTNYYKTYNLIFYNASMEDLYKIDDLSETDSAYKRYVKSAYLSVPDNLQELFDDILSEAPIYDGTLDGMSLCIDYVRTYLNQNTRYTLSPGKLKDNKDFVIDFLTDKKKGYCTSYASATVMMLRYLGIPARYAEGYMIPAKAFDENKKIEGILYVIEVPDSYAHAWTEVYVDGIGFFPVDTTPGSVSNEPQETTTQEETATIENQTTDQQTQNTTQPITTQINTESTSIENDSEGKNTSLIYIVGIIAAMIVSSVVSYKLLSRREKTLDYRTDDIRKNINVLRQVLFSVVNKYGIYDKKNIELKEKAKQLNELIAKLNEVRTNDNNPPNKDITKEVLGIFERARYAATDSEFTNDEYEKVLNYVEKLKKSLQYYKNRL